MIKCKKPDVGTWFCLKFFVRSYSFGWLPVYDCKAYLETNTVKNCSYFGFGGYFLVAETVIVIIIIITIIIIIIIIVIIIIINVIISGSGSSGNGSGSARVSGGGSGSSRSSILHTTHKLSAL